MGLQGGGRYFWISHSNNQTPQTMRDLDQQLPTKGTGWLSGGRTRQGLMCDTGGPSRSATTR